MNTRCKLLAVDLDGTLLDSAGNLPEANRQALHRAHEAGTLVCLTTGRCYSETRPVIDLIGLDLDVAVVAFGAIVSEARSGRTLHAEPMNPSTVGRLSDFFIARRYSVLLLHDADAVGVDYSIVRREHWNPGIDRWFAKVNCRTRHIGHWREVSEPVVRVSLAEPPDRAERMMAEVHSAVPRELYKDNFVHVAPIDNWLLEFFAPVVNKWFGLEKLCARFGIARDNVVAIGDGVNDLEMLAGAGLSYAVANAPENVRAAAGRVTASNDDAGVARAIEEVLANSDAPGTDTSD